ncbi:MAG: hypothetical protein KF773_27435 [Deltaproteobacteria bacterium]|nr:hypothetical protein [Deltaproteobacteria bacterium]
MTAARVLALACLTGAACAGYRPPATTGAESRVSSQGALASPPVLASASDLPQPARTRLSTAVPERENGPIAGGGIHAMQPRPSRLPTVGEGARGEALAIAHGYAGWRHDWLAIAATYQHAVGAARFDRATELAVPDAGAARPEAYGVEMRVKAVTSEGGGIAAHLAWRVHRLSYVWDWGNCRAGSCDDWLEKGPVERGETWAVGWLAGATLYVPLARTPWLDAQFLTLGGGFETMPRLPVHSRTGFDCNSAGTCVRDQRPELPAIASATVLGAWLGWSANLGRHLRLSAQASLQHDLDEGRRLALGAGAEVAW